MIDFTTESNEYNYFGINKEKNATTSDRYHIPNFETMLKGTVILPEIKDFKYGMYDVKLNDSYVLYVPAKSYMIMLQYDTYTIQAFSGNQNHEEKHSDLERSVAWSFANNSYIRIKGQTNFKFMFVKHPEEMKCTEYITILGKMDYKVKGKKGEQFCVYAATYDGKIKVEDSKVATYFDENGNNLKENKYSYDNIAIVHIDNTKSSSSVKFEVGGSTVTPYVIRNTKTYNKYHTFAISETSTGSLNSEDRDENDHSLTYVVLIWVAIGVGILIVIAVAIFLVKKFVIDRRKNTNKTGTGEGLI